MKKRIFSILLCAFLLLGLTACGGNDFVPSQKSFDTKVSSTVLTENKVVAQNSKYTMVYEADTASVSLYDTLGNTWAACPKSTGEVQYNAFGLPVGEHVFIQSALEVGYMNTEVRGGGNTSVTSYEGAYQGGRIVVKEIENGITVEYYFDAQKFMIPVDYVLNDDYIGISIDSTKIQEDELRVTYVSLNPFLNSVENDSEDSYLFMPSGSGSLLNVDSYNEQGISYTTYIYGEDHTMEEKYFVSQHQSVRMPVYGYKSGNKGGFTIIDNGAETATLTAVVGSTSYKFSTIYPSFQLRGYTYHESRTFRQTYFANIYPENMVEGVFSIRFYPLSGEDANYTKMADIYRDYLINEKGLTKTGEDKSLNLSIIGGTQITKSFLGVPYETVFATTTLNQASDIISEVDKSIDNFSVKLKGFGASGIDLGKIGGNYSINSNFGSASNLKNLASLCADNSIDLYFDYDLVRFASSGSGFSYYSDAVMNSGILKADQYLPEKATRAKNTDQTYRLLRPTNFTDAVSKAIKQNEKWNLSGISLETLTSYSYSDYSNYSSTVDYNSRYGFANAVTSAVSQIKENGQKIMANDANDYSAVLANLVTDAPVMSDKGYSFEEDVPFYAMVFKGYVPMTTESINLSNNSEKAILGAVEGGLGLNYTLINEWDNSLIDANYPYFYSTLYSSVKDDMFSTYNDLADYYKAIKDAKIVSNTVIASGVHSTVFDNGVTVYVNYNDTAVESPAGAIEALDYVIVGGAS